MTTGHQTDGSIETTVSKLTGGACSATTLEQCLHG